ncbi:MAG: YMGG-like glycine zipper-containing protein [Hoeflea sp.]|uniref:YMGG-like glycine zipper-containing protein n=1 Tax=Hoeflea sp. TaxID=1940281 RepID=UPI0027316806|nr:YMGG-like glycine zipper-containing protein [Hoeflea sp.]MDP2121190.1 YMGG-like glycine zipper-containing protein [Hoeflea sp.]MDP3527440.1 YMGG-like glycine zipper-containing protein [Hoeflea sp.]MDZ7601292.1 YMGG-like glycine zipper-containing protein [Hoeflea sp.]
MTKLLVVAFAALTLTACTATERGTAIGGASGAAVGAVVASNPLQGAVIGGAVGAVAGNLIGRASEPGVCIYEDRNGRRYQAACQ